MTTRENIASGQLAEWNGTVFNNTSVSALMVSVDAYLNSTDTRANGGKIVDRYILGPVTNSTGTTFYIIVFEQILIEQSIT